jgi:hypothetical protein
VATNYLSNKAKTLLAQGALNLASDTLKWMLVSSSYTPNKDNDFVTSATAAEVSTTGYVAGYGNAGRKTLTTQTVTQDNTNDLMKFTADSPTWTNIGVPAGTSSCAYALLVKETGGSDATAILIATLDAVMTFNGGNFTLTVNASGILTLT